MTNFSKAAFLAATLIAAPAAVSPLFAQAAAPAAVASAPANAAVADFTAAVTRTNAFTTARTQIQTQFKTQIDAYSAKRQPYEAELARMRQEIETLQRTPSTPPATLQAKATAFQARGQAIQTELAPLSAPFERPLAYVEEQVSAKLEQAVRAAMAQKRVTILVQPQALLYALPTADITQDIVTQLNTLVPTATTTVPANWQPGQQGAAPGAPGAAAPAAGAAPAGAIPPRRPVGR